MYGYIYLIINKVNGKTYIGQHKSSKEWYEDTYMGSGKRLYSAKKHYGIENFEKFLICYTSSEKDSCEKEKFWISEYRKRGKAEYNIAEGGNGGDTGEHIRGFTKGMTPWNKNKKDCFSKDSLEKISKSRKGKCLGNQWGFTKGMEPWNKNKKLSQEHIKSLSESHKGNKQSEETKKKISETMKKYREQQRIAKETR
jgi:hypothetical protein